MVLRQKRTWEAGLMRIFREKGEWRTLASAPQPATPGMMDNRIVPWFPLPELPQTPCGIELEGAPERVRVRAVYSFYEGDRDLLIELDAEVFGCFSEIATPPTVSLDDYPRLKHPGYPGYLWPLMEVTNSTWLGSYRSRLTFPGQTYRHYRIVSDDGTFDALTWQEPVARWVAARN